MHSHYLLLETSCYISNGKRMNDNSVNVMQFNSFPVIQNFVLIQFILQAFLSLHCQVTSWAFEQLANLLEQSNEQRENNIQPDIYYDIILLTPDYLLN